MPESGTRRIASISRSRDPLAQELNVAAGLLADELLPLPPAVMSRAVELAWHDTIDLPGAFLALGGTQASIPLDRLLASPRLLAHLTPACARAAGTAVRAVSALRRGHALGRERYRSLVSTLLESERPAATPTAGLLDYTYGSGGQPWPWTAVAARISARVAALNLAAIRLAASAGRESLRESDGAAEGVARIAQALPPVAIPDFVALAALAETRVVDDDGVRHDALFAEMLAVSAVTQVAS
jgi:hypothetical protein